MSWKVRTYLHEVSKNSFLVINENMGPCLYILKNNIFPFLKLEFTLIIMKIYLLLKVCFLFYYFW